MTSLDVDGSARRRGPGMGEKVDVLGCEKYGWLSSMVVTTSAAGGAEQDVGEYMV